MKKLITLTVLMGSAACGGDGSRVTPALDALTLTAPLFSGNDPSCAVDTTAALALEDWLIPVRERLGVPGMLLTALDDAPAEGLSPLVDRFVAGSEGQTVELIRRDRVSEIELELYYEEPSVAGRFLWAEGTMRPDESEGEWAVYDWNGQLKDVIDWEQSGSTLEAIHDLTGSGRVARIARSIAAERVSMQESTVTALLAEWDFASGVGFVEVDGTRSCLLESAEASRAAVCQRVCDDGR
ncbi:MAG: hypothetical protein AAF658_06300 [Myxococcota bacterium]